ncbi:alpha-ketoglutarate-dependent dioxygenase AlkB family protein [Undibacterium sp. Di24W]|uniref:alpha-ketoglutarate-dependent dioxygenase AlkB family protein n=1 Tax=Undibacterium sp. Di24W TaxID=3413033 RepID=UPI003BF39F93
MQQSSLFPPAEQGEIITLHDADLHYFPNFYSAVEADYLFELLRVETPWRQDSIRIAGVQRLQPRLSAWYGDTDAEYTYSGLHLVPLTWSFPLIDIKAKLEDSCATQFNSVLLNYYRDQQDSMGWHSDDEVELGPAPIIASLTLGASREFAFKHKTRKELRYKIKLGHGSLLVMQGNTQKYWLHAIAKEKEPVGARINLTFRRIFKERSDAK